MILRAVRLNVRIREAYTLHIRLTKAVEDPEAFKAPSVPRAEPEQVSSIYLAYKVD